MVWWWLLTTAWGQDAAVPDVNAQLYRAPIDSQRTMWTEAAAPITSDFLATPRLAMHYTNRPLIYLPEGGEPVNLVSDVLQADAVLATSYDRFRVGAYIPVYLWTAGELTEDGAGVGDLGIDGRVTVLDPTELPLGLSLLARFELPTSTVEAPLGAAGLDTELATAVTHRVGDALELSGNLGIRLGPRAELENVTLDDKFVWRAGGGYALSEAGGLSLDVVGRNDLSQPGNSAGSPIEALVGGWVQTGNDIAVKLGVGQGLTNGIGSPQLRTVAMVAYQPRAASDRDADGLVDRYDQCPDEPEDRDSYLDDDGCPDPDNDQDGVVDTADKCPLTPEDLDGWRDFDGCPDPSQQLTIQAEDASGRILNEATTRLDGEQAGHVGTGMWLAELHDGSYTAEATAAGFLPAQVAFTVPFEGDRVVVVMQPEPITGDLMLMVIDEVGMPVLDATWTIDGAPGAQLDRGMATVTVGAGMHDIRVDAPGKVSADDEVEVAAEAVREHLVMLRNQRVVVTREQIELRESIFFQTGSATIKKESHGLLDEVAQVLVDHPEITMVRIEGHTDARGSAESNLRLSDRRADAVRQYLVGQGVEAERLTSEGYGESRPLVQGNNAEAWNKNRRVDLFIESDGEGE